MFIYRHIYDSIEKLIMADLLGFGSQAQKWVTDILVPQLKHIENKQDATLEEVTQLRNDLDLHFDTILVSVSDFSSKPRNMLWICLYSGGGLY